MMNFSVMGSAQTYDSTSFAPYSASTATSIATGNKTWSGSINVSEDFSQKYETIAEKLKAQNDYKIGVISSVNINHATPAAFYAHQESRNNYYDIGLELIDSGFDYFAGGGLKQLTGKEEDQEDLYTLDETLILVTGDHETGGLTIGYAGTDYDTTMSRTGEDSFDSYYDNTEIYNKLAALTGVK